MAKDSASMVAPQPPKDGRLQPVEQLAAERGVSDCTLAGMRRANGWAPGKQVTIDEFETAMMAFAARRMGSGTQSGGRK